RGSRTLPTEPAAAAAGLRRGPQNSYLLSPLFTLHSLLQLHRPVLDQVEELDLDDGAGGGSLAGGHALALGGGGVAVVDGGAGGLHEEAGVLQHTLGGLIGLAGHVGDGARLGGLGVPQIEDHGGAPGDGGAGGGDL